MTDIRKFKSAYFRKPIPSSMENKKFANSLIKGWKYYNWQTAHNTRITL